jgi:hypothetical protein
METKLCPRCGEPYSYVEKRVVHDRIYYYAVHVSIVNDKRKIKKCYLGAKEYYYVKKLHEDSELNLTGIFEKDRYLQYLDQILYSLVHNGLSEEEKNVLKAKLRRALRELEGKKKKPKEKAKINEVVEVISKERKFKIGKDKLNKLYNKILKIAYAYGISKDTYDNVFGALDSSLSYSELESSLISKLGIPEEALSVDW